MGEQATIRAVCVSERKGEQKHPVDRIDLRPHHGIVIPSTGSTCVRTTASWAMRTPATGTVR